MNCFFPLPVKRAGTISLHRLRVAYHFTFISLSQTSDRAIIGDGSSFPAEHGFLTLCEKQWGGVCLGNKRVHYALRTGRSL
jgi:hypothetical protein